MMENQKTVEHTKRLPLLVLKNVVLLPKNIVPIFIGRSFSTQAIEHALENNEREVMVILQKNSEQENPEPKDLYTIGTRATIVQSIKTPKNMFKILLEGIERASIENFERLDDRWHATIKSIETTCTSSLCEREALWRTFKNAYQEYATYHSKMPDNTLPSHTTCEEEIADFVDTIAAQANLKLSEKQQLLELGNLKDRITHVTLCLKTEIEILETEQRIRQHVQNQVETSQREYYLNEQLKAIEKELKNDKKDSSIDEYKKQAKKCGMPAEVYERAEKEITRLETIQPFSAEATVSKTYIEWLISIPWKKQSRDRVGIEEAENLLNQKHAGLRKVKERILEFIAAKKFAKNIISAPVICLVGPPGVGKTSLGKSIAESLNREFIRISLGGVRDEAEIRGHRRTYVGALPGKIIQGMRRAKTTNPLFLLDEIDKMSSDMHGDPAAALLEVLDPEQNKQFMDNYIEVPYDLSKVTFIATANSIDPIPYALFDRMEIINLSGYTKNEKVSIAKSFLIPKQLKEHSLDDSQCIIHDEALELLITEYTREAGVRQLERFIVRILRKTIQMLLAHKKIKQVAITKEKIQEFFKTSPYKSKPLATKDAKIGIATGLAWTEMGGDTLAIEVAIIQGKGSVMLTGQLGDVMQESAQAAISYLRTRSKELGLSKNYISQCDIHVHVPEGATPKDGPSAGITICTAIASALTKIAIRPYVVMTGEITLQGRVLSVGGLKEKLLAAESHGYSTVLVPSEHKELALEAFEELTGDTITLIFVETMDDVLSHALIADPFSKKRKGEILKKKPKASSKKRKE